MKKIRMVLALATALVIGAPASAHHGWGYYDTDRPVYLAGRVVAVLWRNPHPEIVMDVSAGSLPTTWSDLPFPDELAKLGFSATLAKATAPASPGRWTLDLAPINRLERWGLPRAPRVGDPMVAVAFPACGRQGVARPALIVIDGVGVRQQSVALPAGCSASPRG